MHDDSLKIQVPAKLVNQLLLVAQGYTMNRGTMIPVDAIVDEVDTLLWEQGFTHYQDERLF